MFTHIPHKKLTIHLGKYYQSHGFIFFFDFEVQPFKKKRNAQEKLAGWQGVFLAMIWGRILWWKHRRTELWGERRRPQLSWCVFSMREPFYVGWRWLVSYFSMVGCLGWVFFPIPSMYMIYLPSILPHNPPNVGRYTIHGLWILRVLELFCCPQIQVVLKEKPIWQKAMSYQWSFLVPLVGGR